LAVSSAGVFQNPALRWLHNAIGEFPLKGKVFASGGKKMNAVEQAQSWASFLVKSECRGPGDLPNAMRRVAARIGVSYSTIRKLRYAPPDDVFASVFLKLSVAYEAELRRQQTLCAHELEIAQRARPHSMLVRAAAALAGPSVGSVQDRVGSGVSSSR